MTFVKTDNVAGRRRNERGESLYKCKYSIIDMIKDREHSEIISGKMGSRY